MAVISPSTLEDLTQPSPMMPWERQVDYYGHVEFRLDDRHLYGQTTEYHRSRFSSVMADARCNDKKSVKQAGQEAVASERMAHAYVMGIMDALKGSKPFSFTEAMITHAWVFSVEYAYAEFRFQMHESSGKYGYGTAWEHYCKAVGFDPTA